MLILSECGKIGSGWLCGSWVETQGCQMAKTPPFNKKNRLANE